MTLEELLAKLAELTAKIETVAELDNDALAELTSEMSDTIREILAIEELPDDAVAAVGTAVRESLVTLKAETTDRAEKQAARDAEVASLLAELDGPAEDETETEEPAADDAETPVAEAETEDAPAEPAVAETDTETAEEEIVEVEDDKQPVAASATPPAEPERTPVVSRVAPRVPDMRRTRQKPAERPAMMIRASANAPQSGFGAGDPLDSPAKIGKMFGEAMKASKNYRGPAEPMILASLGDEFNLREDWGEDRVLGRDEMLNEEKIAKVCSKEAIRASGGQCAPAPVDYSQPIIGTTSRPVAGALARFGADRGGVVLIPPPQLSDVSGGYTLWTHDNDVTPASPATKNVLTMTCPSATTTNIDAHVTAMKVGNFRQLYWAEQVTAWVEKAAIYAARKAEERLLTLIGAGSKNLNVSQGLGTARDILAMLDRAAAGLRSRNRTEADFPLRFIGPAWLKDNMRADLARQMPGDQTMAVADAELESWFAARHINTTWALDGETGQEFGSQSDGPLLAWPDRAIVYLYPEGSWLHLDGGQLNLGIIRDSTLVGTNDFLMFGEFMESAAFHGTESQRISIDICASGQAQGLNVSGITAFNPCTQNS